MASSADAGGTIDHPAMAGPWLSQSGDAEKMAEVLNDMGVPVGVLVPPLAGRGQMAPVRYAKQWLSSQDVEGSWELITWQETSAGPSRRVLSEIPPSEESVAYAVARACGRTTHQD